MKKNKTSLRSKMKFLECHPNCRWGINLIDKFFDYLGILFLIFSILVFSFCVIFIYMKLFQSKYDDIIRPLGTGLLTIIIIPIISYISKRKNEQNDKQFNDNLVFFEELTDVLLNMRRKVLNEELTSISCELKQFIYKNQSKFALYCSDALNEKLVLLLNETKRTIKQDKNNILYYINASLRILRKISGKGLLSYIPNEFSLIQDDFDKK